MSCLGLPRLPPCIRLPRGPLHGVGKLEPIKAISRQQLPSQQPVATPVNQPAAPLARYHEQMASNGDQTSSAFPPACLCVGMPMHGAEKAALGEPLSCLQAPCPLTLTGPEWGGGRKGLEPCKWPLLCRDQGSCSQWGGHGRAQLHLRQL